MQNASGVKRKISQLSVLYEQMKKHEAIALAVQNMQSFKELGRDTAELEHDLQLLMGQQDTTECDTGGSHELTAVKRKKGAAEAEPQALVKIKASWEPGEIVGLMERNVGAAVVQEAGCKALLYFCFTDANIMNVAGSVVIEAVVAGMREHAGAAGVQVAGFRVLRGLCTTTESMAKVAELKGIDAVLSGMSAHVHEAEVQAAGCDALCRFCWNFDAGNVKIARLGGIEVVVAGMCAHAGEARVQYDGLWALRVFAANPSTVKRMHGLGTVRGAVESAIAAHPSSTAVQERGEKVLKFL